MDYADRDAKGRFVKGGVIKFKLTEKKLASSIKNLGSWIGRIPPMTGRKHTKKSKEKMAKSQIGLHVAEKNGRWIKDRSLIKRQDKRNDPAYVDWVKQVKRRDKKTCRLLNAECKGILTVHHIYSWSKFPQKRYDINNGITLCQAHHPRKRDDEQRLIPIFNKLVGSN